MTLIQIFERGALQCRAEEASKAKARLKKYEPPKAELIWLSPRIAPILVKVFREEPW